MAAQLILDVLDASEINQIPFKIRTKIEEELKLKIEDTHTLKSKYEKLRVNSEQKYFDVEKQLITSNGKLELEISQKAKLQEKLTELETKYAESNKNLQVLQEKRDSFQSSENEFANKLHLLETEKRDLGIISDKRNKEIERLHAELDELDKKLTTANNAKCEAQVKLDEIQSQEVSREHREKRLQAEKAQLEEQVAWFNEQLTEKTNQLSNIRKEKTSHVLELQSELEDTKQELTHQKTVGESLKESLDKQNERMEATLQKLKEERESQVQIEEQFRQELAVQKRLAALYKASSDENDEQVTELTGALEELRKMLKESSEAFGDLEANKADEIRELEVSLKDKDDAVKKLEIELKNANELMVALKKGSIPLSDSAIESLAPSAAATSKLLKSGMSLTEIYSEYVQATDALREEREENRRLNSYMEQILQEIEEKAPLLKKQKEDYETSLQNLEQLTSQLDTIMLECEKLRADNDDVNRKYGHMQRECGRYQKSCQDLSKQVQRLLKEVEELRGGKVVSDEADVSSSEVSSSSIITEKLVTFRNIQDLQKQNEKLIGVCRELSEKKEREESEATSQKMQEMKEQLQFAMSELDHLKDTRARQAEMVETILRQRDMYRVLLQQGGPPDDMSSSIVHVTSTPKHPSLTSGGSSGTKKTPTQDRLAGGDGVDTVSRKELEQTRDALKGLKDEFDSYKKDRAGNEKILNESLDKAKQSLADMRVSNAKLTTQLNFATERYKIVQDNVAGYKKEINLLQDRNHLQASTIHKHESAIAHLKEDLMGAKENVACWQVQVENLKKEKELIKNSENRLSMELESIRREHSTQAMLTASLQAIQNNLERSEFEAKTRHSNQVEGLERELANLRRRIETMGQEKVEQSTSWEDIVKSVHLELKQEKDKVSAAQTKADNALLQLETVKQELSTCEAKLTAAESKIENLVTAESTREEHVADVESRVETEAMKDLKNQIAQQQILIKSLRQQLEAEKKHANQFKTIADNVEQRMKEQRQTSSDLETACEKKVHEAMSEKVNLEKRVELVEHDLQAANKEISRLTTDSASLHGDLRKQVTSLQHALEEAREQRQAAVANCETAQDDSKKQAEIAAQAQDKYQKELMLHAADVEALTTVRKQLEDIQEHLEQAQEETSTYEKQLAEAKTSWAEQERVYKEEVKSIEKRCGELTHQNSVLHEQMKKLSSQVGNIQQKARQESDGGANTSFSEEQGKTSDQLIEVVKFLRKEKDIAEAKLEVVETECNRVKQRFTQVQKQADEATKSLAEERQNTQINAETAANQLELMRKVSNFNILTDSNKLLRDERDQLLNSRHELEAKMRKLESDIDPLQEKIRGLESDKDSVTTERDTLQDELSRWKNRTSNLIEQSNKTDPEENKRLLQEKENMRKQLAQVREEAFKYKNDFTRVTNQYTALQSELNNLKQELNKAREEITQANSQLEEKVKEIEQKTTTINRLKQIGRKYKEQADKINKELEDVKVKAAGQESDKVNVASLEQNIAELRRSNTLSTTRITALQSQLEEAQNEAQAATKRAEQMSAENMSLKEAQEKKNEELTQSQDDAAKLQTEVDDLKQKAADFDRRTAEFEKKSTQSRMVMQNARSKIIDQQNRMKQLEQENADMKSKLSASGGAGTEQSTDESALRTQINHLEKELETAKKDSGSLQAVQDLQAQLDKVQSENSELITKNQYLQRQLEHKHTSSVTPSTSSSDAPKTANIKPMATASSTSRQTTANITSHSVLSSHSPAVKATASIRPMAISPTTSTLPVSGTPTATVMPTTITQAEVEPLPGPSGLQQSSIPAASVSGRVQIVEPQVIERNQDTSVDQSDESTPPTTNQAVVTPSMQQEVTPLTAAAAPIPVNPVNPVTPTPSSMSAMPSTSSGVSGVIATAGVLPQQHTTGVALGKRTREEDGFASDESDNKRTRINTQSLQQSQLGSSATAAAIKPTAATAPAQQQTQSSGSQSWGQTDNVTKADSSNSQEDDDVIMVLSDEDDQEDVDDEEEEGEDEDAEEDYEEEDEEEEDDEEEDEEEEEEGDEIQDADDIEIIDGEESNPAPEQSEDGLTEGVAQPTQRPSATLQPLTSSSSSLETNMASRTQPIAPFMLSQGPGNIFEDDDCTVPSTPTLSQPRRADGFAEALNSPAVNQRFLFGADNGNNPDVGQLESQRALGMDDTRMDLSQLDNAPPGSVATGTGNDMSDLIMAFPESQVEETTAEEYPGQGIAEDMQQREFGDAGHSGEQGGEEDELLEGDAEVEEDAAVREEGEASAGAQGDISSRPGGSNDEPDSNQEKTEGAGKPQIKKIVWDSPAGASTPFGGANVVAGTVLPLQQQRTALSRSQGPRRGGPVRGRGGQYWSQSGNSAGSRGQHSFRGVRGGRGGSFRGV